MGRSDDGRTPREIRPRVLVVDDEPGMAQMYALALANAGYDAVPTRGGEEALTVFEMDRADGRPFGLVLLDIGMPFINGIEVAQAMRRVMPEVKIVFLSAFDEGYCSEMTAQVNPAAHLTKPILMDRLLAAVQKAVQP